MERFSALSRGMQLMLAGGVLLLIDTFLHWQSYSASIGNFSVSASRSGWHGWGVLVGLTTIVLLAWLALRLAAADIKLPVSDALAGIVLGALILLFTLIKVLGDDYRAFWAWVGLVLAAGIAAGAWLEVAARGGMAGLRTEASSMRTGSAGGQPSAPAPPPQAPPPAPPAEEDKGPGEGM